MYWWCCWWISRWIFPNEMFWNCNTSNRNDCSVCRKRKTTDIIICSTHNFGYSSCYIIGFEDIVDEDDDLDFVEESNAQLLDNEISITSPVEGKVIPLTEVKDSTFAQEILGKGAAIIPEKGVVYAPFDGKVDAVFETGHALGLVSEDGVELLVHVGIDTVNLKGKYFTPKKKSGDTMKKGDILLEFDIDKIKADGYDVTTPIIISNTEQFAKVKACEDKVVTKESKLLSVQ